MFTKIINIEVMCQNCQTFFNKIRNFFSAKKNFFFQLLICKNNTLHIKYTYV